MVEVTLQFNDSSSKALDDLMKYYNINSPIELINKAISVLRIAAHVGKSQGELFARCEGKETKIVVN